MNITNKVEQFLIKHNILNTKKPILVAFSGGYDSMCLLHICKNLGLNIIAIHLNHNWRGKESLQEEKNCKEFCAQNNIEFYAETLTEATPQTETFAREARYKFFEKCSNKYNSKIIFTAHNANDNAETILYRISKGTGTIGLSGIAENRDVFYRPLINIKRCEIEKYCDKNGLKPNVDSSNSNIKYKRNLIRHNVIPELKKINIEVVDAINSLSQISIMDNEIIDIYLKSLIDPYKTSNFINYPKAVQLRLLYNLFTSNSLEYDREKITQTLDFIKEYNNSKSGKTLSLTNDLWLFINQKKIEIIEKQEISNIEIKIEKPIQYEIDDKIFVIEEFSKEVKTYPKDSDKIAIVDLSKFDNLILRHRKDGDFIKPLGCSGKQKLKKYLNEKKVPKHEKDKLLLLTSNNEVLWIPSIGISDNIKVVTRPTHMLKLIDK